MLTNPVGIMGVLVVYMCLGCSCLDRVGGLCR